MATCYQVNDNGDVACGAEVTEDERTELVCAVTCAECVRETKVARDEHDTYVCFRCHQRMFRRAAL